MQANISESLATHLALHQSTPKAQHFQYHEKTCKVDTCLLPYKKEHTCYSLCSVSTRRAVLQFRSPRYEYGLLFPFNHNNRPRTPHMIKHTCEPHHISHAVQGRYSSYSALITLDPGLLDLTNNTTTQTTTRECLLIMDVRMATNSQQP